MSGNIEVVIDCPFGSQCEYIGKDEKLHRCRMYIPMKGKHPQKEEVEEVWDCSFNWQVILQLEGNQFTRGHQIVMEEIRNTMMQPVQALQQEVHVSENLLENGDGS